MVQIESQQADGMQGIPMQQQGQAMQMVNAFQNMPPMAGIGQNTTSQDNGFWGNVGNALTGGIGGLIGQGVTQLGNLIFGNTYQDQLNKQLGAQQQLINMQTNANETMSNYQLQNQLKLWNATNYPAQVAQLNMAGLNPALLYGGGGGGGATAAAAYAPVNAPQAPTAQQLMPTLGQQALTLQQIGQTQANTDLAKAQSTKLAGVDTTKVLTDIQNIKAQTTNTEAQTNLTEAQKKLTDVQTENANINLNINRQSAEDQINTIHQNNLLASADAFLRGIQASNAQNTSATDVEAVKQAYRNQIIQGQLMQTQKNVNTEQVRQMEEGIRQKWADLGLENMDIATKNRQITEWVKTTYGTAWLNAGANTLNTLIKLLPSLKTNIDPTQGNNNWLQSPTSNSTPIPMFK